MKEGWKKIKLGDMLQKTEMVDPTKKPNTEFKYIDVSSVNNETFEIETTSLLKGKDAPSRARKLIRTNDVIFATGRPTLKRIAIIPKELNEQVCSTGYFVLRANGEIDSKLIFYYLQTDHFISRMEKLQRGASYPAVTDGDIKEQLFSYPKSPEEQKRIVEILDEAFAAIDKAKANVEKNLQNAKELFESYLQIVFANKKEAWEQKALGEIAFVKSGGTPSRTKNEYWNGDIPWYSSGELNNHFTGNPERLINKLAIEHSNAKLFPKGSLLIGMYDTAALKMSILDRDGTFNQAIAGVKPNDKIDMMFLLHAINTIKPEVLRLRRGVRQKNLSLDKIKSILISFPSIQNQKQIVVQINDFITKIKRIETIYQQKLNDLDELKKSILQKAFTGALTAKEVLA